MSISGKIWKFSWKFAPAFFVVEKFYFSCLEHSFLINVKCCDRDWFNYNKTVNLKSIG